MPYISEEVFEILIQELTDLSIYFSDNDSSIIREWGKALFHLKEELKNQSNETISLPSGE